MRDSQSPLLLLLLLLPFRPTWYLARLCGYFDWLQLPVGQWHPFLGPHSHGELLDGHLAAGQRLCGERLEQRPSVGQQRLELQRLGNQR